MAESNPAQPNAPKLASGQSDASGVVPAEAIDAAADAMDSVHDQDVPWETYAQAALEAAAPAIRAQERERMIERVKAKRRPEEIIYTPGLQRHDQGITDAIRAIRLEGNDE